MNTDKKELLTIIFSKLDKLTEREMLKVALVAKFLHFIRTEKGITHKTFTPEKLDEMAETKLRLDAEPLAKQA